MDVAVCMLFVGSQIDMGTWVNREGERAVGAAHELEAEEQQPRDATGDRESFQRFMLSLVGEAVYKDEDDEVKVKPGPALEAQGQPRFVKDTEAWKVCR